MRIIIFCLALISVSLPAFGAVQGAYHHRFALEGDFLLWKRAKSLHKSLVQAAGGPPIVLIPNPGGGGLIPIIPQIDFPSGCAKEVGKTLIDSQDLVKDMHFQPGVRISAKLFYNIHSTWVLSYTGFLNWKGQDKIHCPMNLNLPGQLGQESKDYHYADRASAIYRSDFYTVDLTYWRHVTPRYTDHFSVSWMIGLRFFDLDEKIKLHFTKHHQTSSYRVKTYNRAFGPFFGGDIEYNPYRFLTWGLAGNIGGVFNRGKQKTLMRDDDNTMVVRDYDPSGSNFGYFAYIYPFIEFPFVKFFTFRIGYEMLFIGRVALADHQFDFHGTGDKLNHEGNIIYHGLFAGMQFNF